MEFAEGLPSIERDSLYELAESVAETGRPCSPRATSSRPWTAVVATAVSTIDGCDWAGIFLFDGDVVVTPAYTDPIVTEADSLQHLSARDPASTPSPIDGFLRRGFEY